MSIAIARSKVQEAGLPQPGKIYWDKYHRGGRYRLIWHYSSDHGAHLNVPRITQEDLEPIAREYMDKLQAVWPKADVQGVVRHGFMYGWDVGVTIHVGGAKRTTPTFEAQFRQRYGYTQG